MLIPSCHYADTKHVLFLPCTPMFVCGIERKRQNRRVHLERIPSSSGPECKRAFLINSSVFVVYFLRLMSLISSVCVSQRKQRMQSLCEFPWAWVTSRKALSKYNNSQLLISYRTGVWIGWRLAPDPDSVQPISDCLWVSFAKKGGWCPPSNRLDLIICTTHTVQLWLVVMLRVLRIVFAIQPEKKGWESLSTSRFD